MLRRGKVRTKQMTKRNLIILSLLALAALAVLVGLGTWQLQRLAWKEQLTARINARAYGSPVELEDVLAKWRADGDVEYARVRLSGRYLHDKERHFYATLDGRPGWHLITPLVLGDARVVFVNRGFIPSELKNLAQRQDGTAGGEQDVIGLVRVPSGTKTWFTPENEPERNQWFWLDLSNMAASVFDKSTVTTLPFIVEAEKRDGTNEWPKRGITRLSLANRHFEYALTWYGLALGLIAVYAFFVRSRLRQQ